MGIPMRAGTGTTRYICMVVITQQHFSALKEPLGGFILTYGTNYELYAVPSLEENGSKNKRKAFAIILATVGRVFTRSGIK